jgi:hypothetical protein
MDIMLDLETLGTKPGCVVLSIGALAFNPLVEEVTKPENGTLVFYQNVTIFDQLLLGLTPNPQTVEWWAIQSEEAKRALTTDKITLQGALFRFGNWCSKLPGPTQGKVWANSPDFDCSIMEHCGKLVGFDVPWSFRDKCDLRTLKRIAEYGGIDYDAVPRVGTHHNALDDCYHQARVVQRIMKGLLNGTQTKG